MGLKPLHDRFLGAMKPRLPGWRFVATHRHFRRSRPGVNLYLHVGFINHQADFDATIDVAVEFVRGKDRVGIVGAELGNIEGVGQVRHSVSCEADAEASAQAAVAHFNEFGVPFLERYSNLVAVIGALESGGSEARLICPLEHTRPQLVNALRAAARAV